MQKVGVSRIRGTGLGNRMKRCEEMVSARI